MQKSGENILFIVGSPRSGTTWVQKILGSHPSIVTTQESEIFTTFVNPVMRRYRTQLKNPSGRGGTGLPCYWTELEFRNLMRNIFYSMIKQVPEYNGRKLFVEKTPSHALVIDIIHEILPKAKYIHIIRDPRNVASSMIAASKSWGKNWAPNNIIQAGIMWRKHTRSAVRSLRKVPKNCQISIKYETLCKDVLSTANQLFSFCEVEIAEKELGIIIKNANSFSIKKFGEFGKAHGCNVDDPKDFIRFPKKGEWRDDIGILRGFLLSLLLRKEMNEFGYKWKC